MQRGWGGAAGGRAGPGGGAVGGRRVTATGGTVLASPAAAGARRLAACIHRRPIDQMRALRLLLALMGAAAAAAATIPAPSSLATCVDDVIAFARDADVAIAAAQPAPFAVRPPLFHLHVPRTAGRTLHGCLLTLAVPPSERCARAYGPGGGARAAKASGCTVLASHDDASLLPLLPAGTGVIVQIRHPLARVLSAYEFAAESAALAAAGVAAEAPKAPRSGGPRTPVAVVWPWSYLVPWVRGEMEQGGAQCETKGATVGPSQLKPLPLHTFVDSPLVADLIHNGATLQVLGATNGSRARGAARVRECVAASPAAASAAADAAEARLRRWATTGGAIGVSERLDESVGAVAAARGWSLSRGPAWPPSSLANGDKPLDVHKLGSAFRQCEGRTRDRSGRRRERAARVLGAAPLGAEGRALLPAELRARILALNAADVRLHAVAGELLDTALGGRKVELPQPPVQAAPAQRVRSAAADADEL